MTMADHRFYVTGGSLPPDCPSYVERKADRELGDALRAAEFCHVLTARQMGKSSVMVRTAALLRSEGVRVAVLDLTAIGQNVDARQWYYSLLLRLGEELGLDEAVDEFWSTHERLGPLRCFMAAIERVLLPGAGVPGPARVDAGGGPAPTAGEAPNPAPGAQASLVIFVDEIDAVRSLPFPTDEFFAAIRECYNRRSENPALRRLTFCLLGVAAPTDLIRDTRITPFNIGRRIELTDFSELEAKPLGRGLEVRGPDSPGGVRARAAGLLKRILYWTGGHPYLTQRLCEAVATAAGEQRNALDRKQGIRLVDELCHDLFLTRSAQEKDHNLIFVRERLLRSELDLAALLELYARVRRGKPVPYDETDPLCSALRLSGIVRLPEQPHRDGGLRVRNRIYSEVFDARWVARRMPDAELRRQRAAYRRGLVRATMLSGIVMGLLGGLAWTALRLASDRRQALFGAGDVLYASQMNLAHLSFKDGVEHPISILRARRLLDLHRPSRVDPQGAPDRRDFVWRFLWRLCRSQDRYTFPPRTGEVSAVAFSPDGRMLAAAGDDGIVQLWNTADNHLLASIAAHHGASALGYSPDSRLLASIGTEDGAIRIWDVTSRPVALRRELPGFRRQWTRVVFTPDGKTLIAGAADNNIRLWDLSVENPTGRSIPFPASGPFAVSADGGTLAISGAGKEASGVTLWSIASGRARRLPAFLPPKGGLKQCVAFSPDGRRLVTGDYRLIVWDAATGAVLRELPGDEGVVLAAEYSPDGKLLASASVDGTIRLWDAASNRLLSTLQGHTRRVMSLAFSPGGDTLASGSADGTVRLWDTDVSRLRRDAERRREAETLTQGGDGVGAVAFSPDGRLLAGVRSRAVTVWSVATGSVVGAPVLEPPNSRADLVRLPRGLAFSRDGKLLATGRPDGTVRVCSVATRQVIRTLHGHEFGVSHLAFTAGGDLVTGNGGAAGGVPASMRLWKTSTGEPLAEVPGDSRHPLGCLAVSPDGRTVAFGGTDNRVALWEVTDPGHPRKLGSLEGDSRVSALAFSPKDRLVAVARPDGFVDLYDTATRRQVRHLAGHATPVLALAFSPDGKTLATGGMDRTIRLWNPNVDQEEATLTGHSDWVWSLAFSPDGNVLASGSPDGTVRLWRAPPFTETDAPPGASARMASAHAR